MRRCVPPNAGVRLTCIYRHLLEQYKTCENAEAVTAMQEKILADLEKSYDESRRVAGESHLLAIEVVLLPARSAPSSSTWVLRVHQNDCPANAEERYNGVHEQPFSES